MLDYPRGRGARTPRWLLSMYLVFGCSYFNGISVAEQCGASSQVYRIKEVSFSAVLTRVTSDWNETPTPAFGFYKSIHPFWHSGPHGDSPSPMPVMIWFDFKSVKIRPDEVSFQPGQSVPSQLQRGPTSYQFVGSNDATCDDSASWTVLCEDLSNSPWRSYHDTKYCKVKPELNEKFRCLGVRVLKNGASDGWVVLRNIRMWERVEKKCTCEGN